MITLDVKEIDDGAYVVSMRCVVSVKVSGNPSDSLYFAQVGRSTAYGTTRKEAASRAATNEMYAEIYRRSK